MACRGDGGKDASAVGSVVAMTGVTMVAMPGINQCQVSITMDETR